MANYYEAYDDGHADGAKEGFKSGAAEGYTKGHAEGAQSGYTKGYEEGYASGYAAGGGGASSEWKYQDKPVLGYAGGIASDFGMRPSVLYAPNAEGALSEGQLADTDFSASSVILDFPKVTSIGGHCFSGVTVDGAQGVRVGSGNFPEVTSVGDDAFVGLEAVTTAGFPKCTSVGVEAFHMHDYVDQSGEPEYRASGSLSFPAMTPMWACFPAMSGTYDDNGIDTPYHIGPMKVPVIPICMDSWDYPLHATRTVSQPDAWHWGAPGSGAEESTDITWSGASCGLGFKLSYGDGTGAGDAGSGYQAGPFGRVLYRNEGGSQDTWQDTYKESKFNVSLPNIPGAAVGNTLSLQHNEAAAALPPCGGDTETRIGGNMNLLGLAPGSTIICSDGVYTV